MIRSIYGQKRRDAFDASLRFLGVQQQKAVTGSLVPATAGIVIYQILYIFFDCLLIGFT